MSLNPPPEPKSIPAVDGLPAELFELIQKHMNPQRLKLCPEILTFAADQLVPFWEAVDALRGKRGEPPFWGWSWPGSQALSRYLLDHPEVARNRVVLDLGAGNGLASVAASLAGAARVIANDVDTTALWMVRLHAARNNVACETDSVDLLSRPAEAPFAGDAGVILAGDLFYSRQLAERAEPWLRRQCARGACVLIGEPGRAYALSEDLRELASYRVQVKHDLESSESRLTRVVALV